MHPSAGVTNVSSGSALERFFPLVDGTLYNYTTEVFSDAPTSGQGLLVARVHRESPTKGELRLPTATRHIEYAPDGVVSIGSTGQRSYVLQSPLAVGKTWSAEGGAQVKVTEMDIPVTVPAGTFQGCVRTQEEHFGDAPRKMITTYCPDVGIVMLEAQSGSRVERASLKQFGPPVDLGPEGVTHTTGNE
jgi:hypothetical protein